MASLGRRAAPLSIPLKLLIAALGRHQVAHVAAHELSRRARRRRDAEDRAQLRAAVRRAGVAPAQHRGRPVLGAWAGNDLDGCRARRWCVVPDGALGLGTLLLNLPGSGNRNPLRLAQLASPKTAPSTSSTPKASPPPGPASPPWPAPPAEPCLFPQEPYDGFRGGGERSATAPSGSWT